MKLKKLFLATMAFTLAFLMIFAPGINQVNAEDATTYNLTITNTTVDNKNLEATYKIKAWKHNINEEVINLGDISTCSVNDTGGPSFWPEIDFVYNNYSYSANEQVTNSSYCPYEHIDIPRYNEISSALKNTTYVLTDKTVEIYEEVYSTYETNMQIAYNNKGYTVYTNFNNFNDVFDPYDVWTFSEEMRYLFIYDSDESFNNYDFLSTLGEPDEEGYYTFALGNSDSKTIPIPEGYEFELKQILPDDWELVSINGSEEPVNLSGTINSDISYTFLNKKPTDDPDPEPDPDPETPITLNDPETPEATGSEPDLAVPNTGESTKTISAAGVGIIALTIIATTARVVYLIRRYQKTQ